jgi:hypothetical protein
MGARVGRQEVLRLFPALSGLAGCVIHVLLWQWRRGRVYVSCFGAPLFAPRVDRRGFGVCLAPGRETLGDSGLADTVEQSGLRLGAAGTAGKPGNRFNGFAWDLHVFGWASSRRIQKFCGCPRRPRAHEAGLDGSRGAGNTLPGYRGRVGFSLAYPARFVKLTFQILYAILEFGHLVQAG